MIFFGFGKHKEQAPSTVAPAEQAPLTEEGITQEAVDKSEAFVEPLKAQTVQTVGNVVIKADQAGNTTPANVVELPAPEIPNPEDPQPLGPDHQLTA